MLSYLYSFLRANVVFLCLALATLPFAFSSLSDSDLNVLNLSKLEYVDNAFEQANVTLAGCRHKEKPCDKFLLFHEVSSNENLCIQRVESQTEGPWLWRWEKCDSSSRAQHWIFFNRSLFGQGIYSKKLIYKTSPPISEEVLSYLNETFFTSYAHPPPERPGWWNSSEQDSFVTSLDFYVNDVSRKNRIPVVFGSDPEGRLLASFDGGMNSGEWTHCLRKPPNIDGENRKTGSISREKGSLRFGKLNDINIAECAKMKTALLPPLRKTERRADIGLQDLLSREIVNNDYVVGCSSIPFFKVETRIPDSL